MRQQDGFLTYGIEHLKPLNLQHGRRRHFACTNSTVSRVTSNKYMSTPRGMFELKYFFTSAIASADSVARRIPPKRCAIASASLSTRNGRKRYCPTTRSWSMLKRDGIDIARRTVAKYREALRIPSSVQRRREKQMAARIGTGA